jgi:peptide/nickel transport system permease protein
MKIRAIEAIPLRDEVPTGAFGSARGGSARIIARYILPNVLAPMLVQVVVGLSYAVLIESALSYLGVGVQPPTPSWGTILNEGKEFLLLSPWISLFPGLFIMLSVPAFNFISDGLRDHLDPRLRWLTGGPRDCYQTAIHPDPCPMTSPATYSDPASSRG